MIYLYQYYTISIFIIFSFLLSTVLIILSYFFGQSLSDFEKTSSYECGFEREVLYLSFI